jgi:hypothetical protein
MDGFQWSWNSFAPITDHADEGQFQATCAGVARDIINQPYHQDPMGRHSVVHIGGNTVYKPNHGVGHSARQAGYAGMLLNRIANEGTGPGQRVAQQVNANPEVRNAIRLAAFCKRIGRVRDNEQSSGVPTSYSKRSADMFARIAMERGYNPQLVAIIRESMLESGQRGQSAQNRHQFGSYQGIDGAQLCALSSSVLMASHKADLVRIFPVKKQLIHQELRGYFDPAKLHQVTDSLVDVACRANVQTGNGLVDQRSHSGRPRPICGYDHRMVGVANDPATAIQQITHLCATHGLQAAAVVRHGGGGAQPRWAALAPAHAQPRQPQHPNGSAARAQAIVDRIHSFRP